MFDLRNEKIDVQCENCNRTHAVTIGGVMNKKLIHCNCGNNIQLTDNNGSVKRSINNINSAFKKLDDVFKKFGR